MEINNQVLKAVKAAEAQLLVVTKYWNVLETQKLIDVFGSEPCVIGWGENRSASLIEKQLPRAQTHFIGRLQSRQLPTIVEHCQTIHSLASFKHAQKLNDIIEQNNYSKIKVFVQVNVAQDPAKEGIAVNELSAFLQALQPLAYLEVIGLSSMGWGDFVVDQKRTEFKQLIALRDQYLPQGQTSAGTSGDYHLALEEGIDIVRVGRSIVL